MSGPALPGRVHVIGASGRSGAALVRSLLAEGAIVVPVVRSLGRWQATGLPGEARLADIEAPATLGRALSDASHIVCTAHARNAGRVIAQAPPAAQLVFLGSTRKFTRWPDSHGNGVLAGERALLQSGRPGIMLHPTMIYGADGENNVRRLAALLRLLPVVPLPGGGRALVQPVNQSDLTRAILACLRRDWTGPHSLVVAGPEPLAYRDFVAAIARAWSLRPRPVVAIPAALLIPFSMVTMALPGLPAIGPAEIRRLLEDKAFDIGPMRDLLGIEPISLEEGLAAMAPRPKPAAWPPRRDRQGY